MRETHVFCGCGALAAVYPKDDGKKELTIIEAVGDCEKHSEFGGYNLPITIPPAVVPFLPPQDFRVQKGGGRGKEKQKKVPVPAQITFKQQNHRERLRKRHRVLEEFKKVVWEEAQVEKKRGRPKFYVIPRLDGEDQPEEIVSLPARRVSRDAQVRARAGSRR